MSVQPLPLVRRPQPITAAELLRRLLNNLQLPASLPEDLGRPCEVVYRDKQHWRIHGTIFGMTPNPSGKLVVLVEPTGSHKMSKGQPRGTLMLEGNDLDNMYIILRENGYDRKVPVALLIS